MGGGRMIWMITVSLLAVIGAVITVMVYRSRVKNTMNNLDDMISSAIDGSFEESKFDESLQSAVETRLAEYLSKSVSTEKNLKEEKERIKELVADISHQTKTPISNIMLYGQLLQEQVPEGKALAALDSLNEQAEKLNFLIQSLVKVSRLETGVFVLHAKNESVKDLCEAVISQIMPEADAKEIAIEAQLLDIGAVFDRKWTAEALYNIMDNAVKYTPAGGRIEITVKKYEMFCRIDIKDTGIGIAEEEQNKVFSRFYRSAAVAGEKGVGIGLYLTRQILSAEDGYVKVSSRRGKGSTFSVYLPL